MLKTMRSKLAFLAILGTVSLPALAAKRMTVDQLQQTISIAEQTHRPDAVVAQQLADAVLGEQLSSTTLKKMTASSPGPKTSEELRLLADQSAFLNLPPAEIPSNPTPDFPTQKAIMGRVVTYVTHALPTLPNFMATRVTDQFSDLPPVSLQKGESLQAGLYAVGSAHTPIAFHNGQESDDPLLLAAATEKTAGAKNAKSKRAVTSGLASWGEFGPILGLVLIDGAKGKLGWQRWEQLDGKPVAVFQFSVGQSVSHYTLQYWRDVNGNVIGSRYGSAAVSIGGGSNVDDSGPPKLIRQITGYHGALTVDPETGTILKITIEADLASDSDLRQAAMTVEYGQVKIGEGNYICPTHSVTAFAAMHKFQSSPINPMEIVRELQLNDVNFTGYRRFGSESTLIVDGVGAPEESDHSAEEGTETASGAAPSPAAASAPGAATTPPSTESSPNNSAAPLTASAEPAAPPPIPKPAPEQEMLITEAKGLPGTEANNASANSSSGNFTLKVTTRLVDLGLVATDKHGKPVADLKPEEIEIYDNGQKQHLAAFHHNTLTATAAQPEPAPQPSDTFTNAATTLHDTQDAPDLLILLMDESHLPFNDLNRARGEVELFLKAARPNSRIALYSINEHGFRVIQDVTSDHSLVEAKLAAWMPSAAGISQAAQLDTRNRQQFDTVRNPSDLSSVNGNHPDTPDYINSSDPQLRQLGDNPLGQALLAMITLARHFGPVPGHKSLAWISGDSVLYDWEDQTVNIERTVKDFNAAINRTKEALNEAHIALYAVDASMVTSSGAAVDASLANPNVQLNPVSTANSRPGGSGLSRVDQGGRMTAEMQQDTRAIQGPVRLLAESTGGRAINKGSDLKATLDSIEQESTALYELAFNPDTQADNKLHTLLIKVPSRKDIKLRYRTSYLYNEEAASTQERFQQAVWSPQDANGISLTADAISTDDSAPGQSSIKLRIDFAGLALEQKDGHWTDNLYIFIAQRDDATQKAEVSGDTLRLSLKQATYDSGMPGGIPYRRAVNVKSKLGSVRVIVVDGNSGKIGSVTIPSSALHP